MCGRSGQRYLYGSRFSININQSLKSSRRDHEGSGGGMKMKGFGTRVKLVRLAQNSGWTSPPRWEGVNEIPEASELRRQVGCILRSLHISRVTRRGFRYLMYMYERGV